MVASAQRRNVTIVENENDIARRNVALESMAWVFDDAMGPA